MKNPPNPYRNIPRVAGFVDHGSSTPAGGHERRIGVRDPLQLRRSRHRVLERGVGAAEVLVDEAEHAAGPEQPRSRGEEGVAELSLVRAVRRDGEIERPEDGNRQEDKSPTPKPTESG